MEKLEIYNFRGYSKAMNKWLYGNLLDSGKDGFGKTNQYYILPHDVGGFDEYEEVETDSIGQCSGIRDAKKELIWLGDKVKDSEDKTYIVEWNNQNACFWLSPVAPSEFIDDLLYVMDNKPLGNGYYRNIELEIVGDKYDQYEERCH